LVLLRATLHFDRTSRCIAAHHQVLNLLRCLLRRADTLPGNPASAGFSPRRSPERCYSRSISLNAAGSVDRASRTQDLSFGSKTREAQILNTF
jgi:hypothetical protein